LCAAFAAAQTPNHQKIYPIDSEVYQALKLLYISRGLALPSTTGPWSEDELLLMLDRLDAGGLNPNELTAYEFAEAELNREHKVFQFGIDATVELRGHTDTENFIGPETYIRPWNYAKPLAGMEFETFITPLVYATTSFDIGNDVYSRGFIPGTPGYFDGISTVRIGSALFGQTAFSTNIPLIPPAELDDISFNFPSRAFGALGGNGWNIVIGRDRLSWGPGESGNFLVGNHIEYHNSVRATFYHPVIKYTFNISGFPHPDEYYDDGASPTDPPISAPAQSNSNKFEGVNLFIAHRIEWRMLKNKLGITLNEGLIYQSSKDDGMAFPLEILSPTILLHNLYRAENANSIISIEADYSVMPFLNIYGQFVMDDFVIPGVEPVPGKDASADPTGMGYMLGVKTAIPWKEGFLFGSLEGAYTDPYLYLRSNLDNPNKPGINYVVATRYYGGNYTNSLYMEDFLGYRWGGDAIVLNLHGGYRKFGAFSLEGNFMMMVHGTYDKWTIWDRIILANADRDYQGTPTKNLPGTPGSGSYDPNQNTGTPRDTAAVTLAFSVTGAWQILSWLNLYGQIDLVTVDHPGNVKANGRATDFQYTLGATVSW
jgi:hypothetical protein